MRMNHLVALAVTVCGLVCVPSSQSRAALLAFEDFEDYDPGALLHEANGGTGWSGGWNILEESQAEVTILDAGLVYNAGEVFIDGGARAASLATAGISGAPVLGNRPLQANPQGTIYYSFLFESSSMVQGDDDFIQWGFNSENANPVISVGERPGGPLGAPDFFSRASTASSVPPTAWAEIGAENDVTNFMVARASKNGSAGDNYDTVELWVNPTTLNPSDADAIVSTADTGIDNLQEFLVRVAFLEDGDNYNFDRIRVGESFADVMSDAPPPTPGDFNQDGAIDLADFDVMRNNFLDGTTFAEGDMNFDGRVDLRDFSAFRDAFQAANGAAAVPEPSAWILLALGFLAVLHGLRRRSHRA